MENLTFGKKELKELIESEIKNAFDAESAPSLIPNIKNKLAAIGNDKLQKNTMCKFGTFLALACGFLYERALNEAHKKQNIHCQLRFAELAELNEFLVKKYFTYTEEALIKIMEQYDSAHKKIDHQIKSEHKTLAGWLKYTEEKNAQIRKHRNEGPESEAAKLVGKTFSQTIRFMPPAEVELWKDIHDEEKFINIVLVQ